MTRARGIRQSPAVATDPERDACSCYYVDSHEGVEAENYVANHLEKVRTDSEMWTVEYRCPLYGKRWLQDQPWGEMHGGGPYRLRTAEKVRRDLRNALASVPFAIPDDDEAIQMARSLMEKAVDRRS